MSESTLAFPYKVVIEVPFRDLDAMGHVNNAVYFSYMETARIKFLVELLAVTFELVSVWVEAPSPVTVSLLTAIVSPVVMLVPVTAITPVLTL